MKTIIRATPLYGFLGYCNVSPLDKIVLDCGAGGDCPPLAIFLEQGYQVHGIDISDSQIGLSNQFCIENGIDLNIKKGDVRKLPYGNGKMSFVYSYNSIFHLTKADTRIALEEMSRVLKKDGICFINVLSIDDCGFGEGEKIGEGEFIQTEGAERVVHSYYENNELDKYLKSYEIIRKEKRDIDFYQNGVKYEASYIDYIFKK
jgi:ubiquinone/menaquinone biosynthesis C-methylase UbiE